MNSDFSARADPALPYQDKHDPWSSHSLINDHLKRFPPGTRVLDVGTASGTIGRLCQNAGFVLRGLEPVVEWAEMSRPFYSAFAVQSLAETDEDFLRDQQVVVLADVLEHMADARQQLIRLAGLQQPGTVFLISLPNIANLWVRLLLLFGKFDYTDRGILDRTHLRFFTMRTASELLQDAGLQIKMIQPTPVPLNLVHPFFAGSVLGRAVHRALAQMTRIFPTLLGYQFVFRAEKVSQKDYHENRHRSPGVQCRKNTVQNPERNSTGLSSQRYPGR